MPYNHYLQVSKERYDILCKRYEQYMRNIDNLDLEPVKIFDPLGKKHLDELELIREVSRELAKKKNDDMKKAKQAAEAEAKAAEVKETETELETENTEKTENTENTENTEKTPAEA